MGKSLKALNKAYGDFTKQHGEILSNTVTERENEDGTVTVTRRFKNEALIRLDAEERLPMRSNQSIRTAQSAKALFSKGAR